MADLPETIHLERNESTRRRRDIPWLTMRRVKMRESNGGR